MGPVKVLIGVGRAICITLWYCLVRGINGRGGMSSITDILPKAQVQAFQFPLHISYFLQNCKKSKPGEMDLPLLKNDITTSEPAFGIANI